MCAHSFRIKKKTQCALSVAQKARNVTAATEILTPCTRSTAIQHLSRVKSHKSRGPSFCRSKGRRERDREREREKTHRRVRTVKSNPPSFSPLSRLLHFSGRRNPIRQCRRVIARSLAHIPKDQECQWVSALAFLIFYTHLELELCTSAI